MIVIFINVYKCRGCGDLASNIGSTNENPSPIQFLINLLTAQRNLYLDSLNTLASHGWETVSNHMWPDKPVRQAREPSEEFVG